MYSGTAWQSDKSIPVLNSLEGIYDGSVFDHKILYPHK